MKKWSFIVAGLYGLILLVLIMPLVWIAFGKRPSASDFSDALLSWQLWLVLAIMMTAQFALLRIPVHAATRRPQARRSLLATVLSAAFMMALLMFGGCLALYEWMQMDKSSDTGFWICLAAGIASWTFWALYFYSSTKSADPHDVTSKLHRFLWAGSILELLVAIPTHIIARDRHYCCAGFLTFVGLTCGLSVMLFAFGPAIYFLFIERWRRLHPAVPA